MRSLPSISMTSFAACVAFGSATLFSQITPQMPKNYQAMMKAMQDAQTQASRPGDEKLDCDALQDQMITVVQDPALLAQIEAAGKAAEQDKAAAMKAAKAQAAAQAARTLMSSIVPGGAMLGFMGDAASAQAQGAQAAGNIQSRMQMGQDMMQHLPKLLRGQRLIELGVVKKCEFAAIMTSPDASQTPPSQ
jgi:hypothetical protein